MRAARKLRVVPVSDQPLTERYVEGYVVGIDGAGKAMFRGDGGERSAGSKLAGRMSGRVHRVDCPPPSGR